MEKIYKEPNWETWNDIERYAFCAAKKAYLNKVNQKQLEEKYFSSFAPSSIVFYAENMSEIYLLYLKNELDLEEAKKREKAVHEKYDKMIKVIRDSSLAFTAIAEAFKKAGKDAESAEFTCPYCGEKNTAHKYNGNLYARCKKGCFTIM